MITKTSAASTLNSEVNVSFLYSTTLDNLNVSTGIGPKNTWLSVLNSSPS